MHWGRTNALETLGAVLMAISVIVFLYNVVWSRRRGEIAGNNPWYAGTLEWATTSPPPIYNFLDLPTVAGREPLWENPPDQPVVTGLREDIREVLVTKPMDADPDHRTEFPYPTIWPFLAAIATTILFVWSIFSAWALVYATPLLAITMTGWFWPKRSRAERRRAMEVWDKPREAKA
jgi:heme/copper-type cytochrome/quinol oxidase subunit 1